jgi:cleavage and polyadenylation specificity factor subunit 1
MHTTTAPRSYPVIFAAEGLPYDCLSLVACPPSVGGVLVLAAGSLIHVTSSSRRLVVPTTGWSARIADPAQAAQPVPLPASLAALPGGLDLTGAHCAFVSGDAAILVAVDGSARPLRARMDGALLASLELGAPIAHTGPPALLRRLDVGAGSVEEGVLEHLFLGSTAGDSLLLDVEYVEEAAAPTTNGVDHGTGATLATKVEDAMQLDDDDDGRPWSFVAERLF